MPVVMRKNCDRHHTSVNYFEPSFGLLLRKVQQFEVVTADGPARLGHQYPPGDFERPGRGSQVSAFSGCQRAQRSMQRPGRRRLRQDDLHRPLAGAMTPNQASYSNSGIPASAKVGTEGSVASRLGAAIASGRTFPELMSDVKWQNEPKFNLKQSRICFSHNPFQFTGRVALAFVGRMPDARSVRASATRGGRE